MHINYIAVLVAALAGFAGSSIYYVIFGKALTAVLPDSVAVDMRRVPAWKKAAGLFVDLSLHLWSQSLLHSLELLTGGRRCGSRSWCGLGFLS